MSKALMSKALSARTFVVAALLIFLALLPVYVVATGQFFPLSRIYQESWSHSPGCFGANRSNGLRAHAGAAPSGMLYHASFGASGQALADSPPAPILLRGLSARVDVFFDGHGIPHLYASSLADAAAQIACRLALRVGSLTPRA